MLIFALPDIVYEDGLMTRLRRGDQEALGQVFDVYFEALYHFARPRVDNQREAEDVVSEVFLKLVGAFKNKKLPNHSLRGWLFQVARHELYDRYKLSTALPLCELDDNMQTPEQFDTEHEALRQVNIEHLRGAIQQLTPDQQEVIILRFGQMMSLKETAEILDKNTSAVKVLQYRAINALRRMLGSTQVSTSYD